MLLEEVEEWWASIKGNCENHYELVQIMAVCMRYVIEQGDVASIRHVMEMRRNYREARKGATND